MIPALSALTFLNPWILGALTALPVLWYLLRVLPPPPRRITLPTSRFLEGLTPPDRAPHHTPWWILLLRLLAVSLLILALAHPVMNASQSTLSGKGPLRLVLDTCWPAAQTWPRQLATAETALREARAANRPTYLLTTCTPDPATAHQTGPMAAADALSQLRGITPLPWPADLPAVTQAARKIEDARASIETLWLAHGLDEGGIAQLADILQRQGPVTYMAPPLDSLPVMLTSNPAKGPLAANILYPFQLPPVPVTTLALTADGSVLDTQGATLDPEGTITPVTFDLPAPLKATVARLKVSGRPGAGTVLLLGTGGERRPVGIVGQSSGAERKAPLLDAGYYLSRALEPYAEISRGSLTELLKKDLAVLILPDVGGMPADTLEALTAWVRKGGVLLRFAGPDMAAGEATLTPVPLRGGGRTLEGALTWDKPLHIAPIPTKSPLADLTPDPDVTVERQVLAEPVANIDDLQWVTLEDGTPLVTAAPEGSGLIILVHTTASPAWSNLALSGFYVDMLRRIASLSPAKLIERGGATASGVFEPMQVLDGQGTLVPPGPQVRAIPAKDFATIQPSAEHPPGFYRQNGLIRPLNLGDRIPRLVRADTALPRGVTQKTYATDTIERDLMPPLLTTAFLLFLFDWLLLQGLMIWGGARRSAAASILLLLTALSSPALAGSEAEDIASAERLRFAYVRSGDAMIDATTERGLEALAEILRNRTAVDPGPSIGIDPATDTMAFFPLLYWVVTPDQPAPSPETLRRVQEYLDRGGAILFDTRDSSGSSETTLLPSRAATALRRITSGLDIPALAPAPADHVLTKSFYLMQSFPGMNEGPLWVEETSLGGRDGVSSVLIGGNDWAAAWSGESGLSGRQREMALRFGVNIAMYALTGNYKADQVHLPHILRRLGH